MDTMKRMMGDIARTVFLGTLSNHLHNLQSDFELWGEYLSAAERAALLSHIKATERLAKTIDSSTEL